MLRASPTLPSVNGPAHGPEPSDESVALSCEIDRVNKEYLLALSDGSSGEGESMIRIIEHAMASLDQDELFTKKRGCGRKKEKVSVDDTLPTKLVQYISISKESYSIPTVDKTLRIILDWAMEEKIVS